jgi:hypothetical protein
MVLEEFLKPKDLTQRNVILKLFRGSLYVANGHLYMTTFNNEIIQLGDGDFATGFGNRVVLKSWLHH